MLKVIVGSLVVLVAASAWANDTVLTGVGGVWKPLKGEHRHVRMVAERVTVKLPKGEVQTRFVFENDGPATTVTIGFPESSYSPNADTRADVTRFGYFRTWVDGRQVPSKRVVTPQSDECVFEAFWVREVRFAAGQRRVIVNRYKGGLGELSTGDRTFHYSFATGANWKGPIERAEVVVDFDGVDDVLLLEAFHGLSDGRSAPRTAFRRTGQRFTYSARGIVPQPDTQLAFRWLPYWDRLYVNGTRVRWGALDGMRGDPAKASPRIVDGRLMVRVRDLPALLGGTLGGPMERPTFALDGRMVDVFERDALIRSNGWRWAQLAPLVRRLGGVTTFDRSTRAVSVRLEGARPAGARQQTVREARRAYAAPVSWRVGVFPQSRPRASLQGSGIAADHRPYNQPTRIGAKLGLAPIDAETLSGQVRHKTLAQSHQIAASEIEPSGVG